MVNKKTIGKVQIIIGIIVLIAGIGGLIYSEVIYSDLRETIMNDPLSKNYIDNKDKLSNETNVIIQTNMHYGLINELLTLTNTAVLIVSSSIIVILLSGLFITQGLVNISENK